MCVVPVFPGRCLALRSATCRSLGGVQNFVGHTLELYTLFIYMGAHVLIILERRVAGGTQPAWSFQFILEQLGTI